MCDGCKDDAAVLTADVAEAMPVVLEPVKPAPPTVSDRLFQARAAHQQYRRLHDLSKNGNAAGMRAAVTLALEQRTAAHAADPEQTDDAWGVDLAEMRNVASADLMAFYRRYVS